MKKIIAAIAFAFLLGIPVSYQSAQAVANPTIGEIMWFGGNFAPREWASCSGQLLQISQNSDLFSLLSTTYGPDGRTTFGLPDFRGRMLMHEGSGPGLTSHGLGARGGVENVQLSVANLPIHNHQLLAFNGFGDNVIPTGRVLHEGIHPFLHRIYSTATPNTVMNAKALANSGGSQQHTNMPPFLTLFCNIALAGTFNQISDPTLGEVRFLASNQIPNGYAECDGQTLSTSQNDELFDLLGTTWGGDGTTTFELPDMRSRMLMGAGPNHPLGSSGGTETVTLTEAQMPSHTHALQASTNVGNENDPLNQVLAKGDHPFSKRIYRQQDANTNMDAAAISNVGGGTAHTNMPPFLNIKCVIALFGTVNDFVDPLLGELRWLAYEPSEAIPGTVPCDGRLLSISQNSALFSLYGTTYGGDGRTTFAVPDLEDRFILGSGNGPGLSNRQLGSRAGTETVTLTQAQMPSHTHSLNANNDMSGADSIDPQNNVLGKGISPNYHDIYGPPNSLTQMHASAVSSVGGGEAHNNMPPNLALHCLVMTQGLFPSRN